MDIKKHNLFKACVNSYLESALNLTLELDDDAKEVTKKQKAKAIKTLNDEHGDMITEQVTSILDEVVEVAKEL